MTLAHAFDSEFSGELPPGAAPAFGNLPDSPFEHTPERLVLSSDEHAQLAGIAPLSRLGGRFETVGLGQGHLTLVATGSPGEVLVEANVEGSGPAMHLSANVRESWLLRAAGGDEAPQATARVVGELVRLAGVPHQSTVSVRVDAD